MVTNEGIHLVTTVAAPILDTKPAKSPEFFTPQSLEQVICPRTISMLAIGNMMNAESLDQFALGTTVAMDPLQAIKLREVDRESPGKIVLGNTYGYFVAESLLSFAERNYRQADDASEIWLGAREKLAKTPDFDGGVLKIALGGMTQVFRRSVSEKHPFCIRSRTSLKVLTAIYPNNSNIRSTKIRGKVH